MSELNVFCDEIKLLPPQGPTIFALSRRENAFKSKIYNSVLTIIENNIDRSKTLKCIDFFCGHGIILNKIKNRFNSEVIGIDINKFYDWKYFSNVNFFQKDVFEVIKLNPPFKFDIILTFNTLRAESRQWGEERYNTFLSWCNKHSNYLITNKCTDKELNGFQLIDTIQTPGIFDTNLFKTIDNG